MIYKYKVRHVYMCFYDQYIEVKGEPGLNALEDAELIDKAHNEICEFDTYGVIPDDQECEDWTILSVETSPEPGEPGYRDSNTIDMFSGVGK